MTHRLHSHGHTLDPHPTPPETTPPPEISSPPTTTNTTDFAQLGAVFDDATRALVGGLWQDAVEEAGQGLGSVFRYVNDLNNVKSGMQAEISAGSFNDATLEHAQDILSNIETAISAATASVNGGGSFGSVAAAETALHDSHLDVLDTVASDPSLSALARKDGVAGFMPVPPTLDSVSARNAPHANLAEIGAIFNDAANRILGGVNADNEHIIAKDVHAVIADMKQLIADQPDAFSGLTGVHADVVVRQLELELSFIRQAGVNPDAGRASNDNILDIIDIVQGDPNLAQMASHDDVVGFSPFPNALNPTPKYLDNQAQTSFWANFIADSNSLGQQAMQVVGQGDKAATGALIAELRAFEKSVTHFDAAQGGIFEARFDNELLGKTSTLGAELDAMIKGLKSGNADLVAAAAEEMHTNAADVGGNNVPITGGTYNADGLTVSEVLPQAVAATTGTAYIATGSVAVAADAGTPGAPALQSVEHEPHHHFEHLWT